MKFPSRLILLLCLIGFGLVLAFFYWQGTAGSAHRTQMLPTWGLGQAIARGFPNGKVLVISNPFVLKKGTSSRIINQEENRIEGLKAGLGSRADAVVVGYPELKPGALENPHTMIARPSTTTPISFLVTPGAFDKLIGEHPDAVIVVSLVGLPANLEAVATWSDANAPPYALLFPDFLFLGGPLEIQQAMDNGRLIAFVMNRPGINLADETAGKPSRKEFDKRHLLVDGENIGQILTDWPELFENGL